MTCKKCGANIYNGVKQCVVCFAPVVDGEEFIVLPKTKWHGFYDYHYAKFFGNTDKRVVKKLFKFLILFFLVCLIFYHFFLYIDIGNKCFIKIKPALVELTNTTMKRGIKYLKKNHFPEYKLLCENVTTINPNISCGGFGGGCYSSYRSDPGEIDISTTYGNVNNAAKVIIHETCHAVQFKEGRSFDEAECYAKDSIIPWH